MENEIKNKLIKFSTEYWLINLCTCVKEIIKLQLLTLKITPLPKEISTPLHIFRIFNFLRKKLVLVSNPQTCLINLYDRFRFRCFIGIFPGALASTCNTASGRKV